MPASPFLVALGYVGAAANILMGVPQVLRVRKDGVSGVSPMSLVAWLGCNVAWAAWAVAIGDLPVLLSCGFGAIAPLVVAWIAARDHHTPAVVTGSVVVAAALLPVYAGVAAAGWVATALSVAYNIPQVVRSARSSDMGGLSLGRYAFEQVRIGCWIVYGLVVGLAPLVVTSVLQLVSVVVLTVLVVVRRCAQPKQVPAVTTAAQPSAAQQL